MTELRNVVRAAYPPILADQGLDGALTALAAGCGVPARIRLGDLGEVPAAVEAVAHFAVTSPPGGPTTVAVEVPCRS
ncbi:hypothetical protein ACWD4G_35535 [Streptomyces sp. NPDC002643]